MTLKKILLILFIVILIPVIIILYLYWLSMNTGLPGRRGGPQDAFRHTYSTAMASRYISPGFVKAFTEFTEPDINSPYDKMDRHNNNIGSQLGQQDGDLYSKVLKKVSEAQVNSTDKNVLTLLPKNEWDNGL